MVASDFVYSMQRLFDPKARSQGEWLWQKKIKGLDEWKEAGADYSKPIEGLKALDDHTIQIILNKPFPQLTYTFAMGYSSVTPREAVDHYGEQFGLKPVGSGPYKLKSFSTKKAVLVGTKTTVRRSSTSKRKATIPKPRAGFGLERLQGKKLPIMDTSEVYFMKERMTRWNSLNKGSEIHYGSIPTEKTKQVAEELNPLVLKSEYAKKFTAMNLPNWGIVISTSTCRTRRLAIIPDPEQNRRNLLLRKAISAAYDWPQRKPSILQRDGDLVPGTIPPGLDGYDERLHSRNDRARLRESESLPQRRRMDCRQPPRARLQRRRQCAEHTNVRTIPRLDGENRLPARKNPLVPYATFGDFNKKVKQRECTLIGMAWGLDYPDAENVLQLFYGPNGSPGSKFLQLQ